jgi:hypothetical protein
MPTAERTSPVEKVILALFDIALRVSERVRRRPRLSWACWTAACLVVCVWAFAVEFLATQAPMLDPFPVDEELS